MMRRQTNGGDLNLIRVLRHDLSEEPLPASIPLTWRVVALVLAAAAAILTAVRAFL